MKVNQKNNRFIKKLAIIAIILAVVNLILDMGVGANFLSDIFVFLTGISIAVFLTYIISILQFANESISIQTPFSSFLGLEVITLLSNILPIVGLKPIDLSPASGVLTIILTCYMMLMCFKVKNIKFSRPFKFLGILLLTLIVLKLLILFLFPIIALNLSLPVLSTIVFLAAMLNIINKTGEILDIEVPVVNSVKQV